MLYSSEWLLKNKVDTNKISEKYPNALWVAKYKTNGREDNPDYNYFPSMDNVAIWQYTQNWRGQNVDGNVNVVPLSNKTTADNNDTSTNAANTNNPMLITVKAVVKHLQIQLLTIVMLLLSQIIITVHNQHNQLKLSQQKSQVQLLT